MKKTTIVLICAVLFGYVFGYIFGRQDGYMQCNERVEQAIQATSDDLLGACETRIDEILGQF